MFIRTLLVSLLMVIPELIGFLMMLCRAKQREIMLFRILVILIIGSFLAFPVLIMVLLILLRVMLSIVIFLLLLVVTLFFRLPRR